MTVIKKTLTDLYSEYTKKYNGKPKHSFSHFIRIINSIKHHNSYIRPMIKWWTNDIDYK